MNTGKLVARQTNKENTLIEVSVPGHDKVIIGSGYCTVIAGPCAIESRDDFIAIALALREMGVHVIRGGAYKPRTSPYSFPGLGPEGLEILAEARMATGLPVVTEIMDARDLDAVSRRCDILQVGSRNMQNFTLLKELGRVDKPVILKRGLSATIEEWLLAAEYILNGGNSQVILCERGIRTFETATRNTLDITAIPMVKQLSHLPVIVDPSHATGLRSLVGPAAKAAITIGADGVMIEVHQDPDRALSDGPQSLTPQDFSRLLQELKRLAQMENRSWVGMAS